MWSQVVGGPRRCIPWFEVTANSLSNYTVYSLYEFNNNLKSANIRLQVELFYVVIPKAEASQKATHCLSLRNRLLTCLLFDCLTSTAQCHAELFKVIWKSTENHVTSLLASNLWAGLNSPRKLSAPQAGFKGSYITLRTANRTASTMR